MGNIVWLASYPKSGNTWLRAFIYNLIEQPAKPGRLTDLPGYFLDDSKPRWYQPYAGDRDLASFSAEDIFALRQQVQRDIAGSVAAGTVFTKTHSELGEFNGHPLINIQVTAGAIYIVRNPLDVVLSVADHFAISIDEAIDFMGNPDTGAPTNEENVTTMLGSWSTHVASWTNTGNRGILVLRYEDMLDRPQKAFLGVMKLLGLNKDPARLKRAIRFSEFRELAAQESRDGFVERSPDAERFFRVGRKNQWRDVLSDEQVARLVDDHYQQMERFRYIPPRFRKPAT